MISEGQARQKAKTLYDRKFPQWAVAEVEAPVVDIPLHPPTEEAVLADTGAVAEWIAAWRDLERRFTDGGRLNWESRRWASAGTQRVPTRLSLEQPADLAAFIGSTKHWAAARHRTAELLDLLHSQAGPSSASTVEPVPDALRRRLKKIVDLSEGEYRRLRDALAWLLQNPNPGIYPRQMPIRGVDSKWLEKNSALVEPLYAAATGSASLGLRKAPRLIRVRVLDPAAAPAGLQDLAAPVEELNRLTLSPQAVLMVENLQTLLALPEITGVVAIHSAGYAAKGPAEIRWLKDLPIVYWGDLDVDGFRILSMVRTALPQTVSTLMDRSTLKEHLDLVGHDRKDAPRALPEHLTGLERDGFAALEEFGEVRLEQERIPWGFALAALQRILPPRP